MSDAIDLVMIGPFPEDVALIKGGVQASVYGLSRALKGKTHIGSLYGFSMPVEVTHRAVREARLDGIDIAYLSAPYRFKVSAVVHLRRIMRKIRILKNPVVHIHGTGLLEMLICLSLRVWRVPYVWTLHGITEKEMRDRLREHFSATALLKYIFYASVEWLMLAMSNHVIVDTEYVREALAPKIVKVIPQGIFTEELASSVNPSVKRNDSEYRCHQRPQGAFADD